MYYLTYRPQKISQIDNHIVAEKLQAILSKDHLPHAILFSGPKGTGKTSSARLIARSINCLQNKFANIGSDYEPCNDCENCKTILADNSPDVIEIDSASTGGVDDIRELINSANLVPLISKYKVYILDEFHMLSKSAFNAFLKTLEEPPKNVIFILATTEREKLLKTILSRCVEISVPAATKADVVNMLKRICIGEKLDLDEDIFDVIFARSDTSFRNAARLLEELVINDIKNAEKARIWLDNGLDIDLVALILEGDVKKVLFQIDKYSQAGGDFSHLSRLILTQLHDILISQMTEKLEEKVWNLKDLTRLIRLINESHSLISISPIASLPLELAVIEYFSVETSTKN